MQVFWVSGAVGKIHRINLTLNHLLISAIILGCTLVLLGVLLQYLGFQMAIEYNPQLARRLGNVHTAIELENLNAHYRKKLAEIEKEVALYQQKISSLEQINQQLAKLATPPLIQNERSKQPPIGGPFVQHPRLTNDPSVMNALQNSLHEIKRSNKQLQELSVFWKQYLTWLKAKPAAPPIAGNLLISSDFGSRIDPFRNNLSEHLGIDLQSQVGANILAAGDGHISKATFDPIYGNFIVIDHDDAFQTKYAHASELTVKEGQNVLRGDVIARVGSTGRATGPHLHYEVIKNGVAIDPMQMLAR